MSQYQPQITDTRFYMNYSKPIWEMLISIIVGLLAGLGVISLLTFCAIDAHAEGTEFQVGTERTATWDAVTTRNDGRPVKGSVTYNVYAGTSDADMKLVREGVTTTTATGIPTVEGQNYIGVVTVEAGNTAGPSPMSALFPFVGVVPDSPPKATVVRSLR